MKHIYLIDTKLIAYYIVQRGGGIGDIFNKIASILINYPKGEVFLAFDYGKSDYRLGIHPNYKGHRKEALKKKSQAEQEAHARFNQDYLGLMNLAKILPVRVLAVEGVEADDLVSIVSHKFQNRDNTSVKIITNDYDYFHLCVETNNVTIIGGKDFATEWKAEDVHEKYGLTTRRQFSVLKSISGDKSDNIKFIRNIAEVKGKEIFDIVHEHSSDPTDEEIIRSIEEYLVFKDTLELHEYHEDKTVGEAFLDNMKIADPFTDTSKMTEVQEQELEQCRVREVPTYLDPQTFFNASINALGYPIQLSQAAKTVFKVRE